MQSTPDKLNRRVTAHDIDQLFRQAWPEEKAYPDLNACSQVATRVNLMADRESSRRSIDEDNLRRSREALRLAKKAWGAFERAVPGLRFELERHPVWGLDDLEDGEMYQQANEHRAISLAAIDTALASGQALFSILHRPPELPDHRAEFVAAAARTAWAEVKRSPRAVSERSPLTLFVTQALASVGMHLEATTVSGHLRGQRKRPR